MGKNGFLTPWKKWKWAATNWEREEGSNIPVPGPDRLWSCFSFLFCYNWRKPFDLCAKHFVQVAQHACGGWHLESDSPIVSIEWMGSEVNPVPDFLSSKTNGVPGNRCLYLHWHTTATATWWSRNCNLDYGNLLGEGGGRDRGWRGQRDSASTHTKLHPGLHLMTEAHHCQNWCCDLNHSKAIEKS